MLTIQHRLTEGPNRELYLSLHAKTRCWGANCCAGLVPTPLKLTAPVVLIGLGPETRIAIGNERGRGAIGAGSGMSTRTGARGVVVGTNVTERGPTPSRLETATATVTTTETATGTARGGARETENGVAATGTARTGTDVASARTATTFPRNA